MNNLKLNFKNFHAKFSNFQYRNGIKVCTSFSLLGKLVQISCKLFWPEFKQLLYFVQTSTWTFQVNKTVDMLQGKLLLYSVYLLDVVRLLSFLLLEVITDAELFREHSTTNTVGYGHCKVKVG